MMKLPMICLSIALGVLSAEARAETVQLTKDDVTSAIDIEAAIQLATAGGTEAGIVILDGSAGPFTYTGGDASINIAVSDLTLRGINRAALTNCADGLFFDQVPVSNILIEGISFDCTGNGIGWFGPGPREEVTVQDNVIQASSNGIQIGDSLDWLITRNIIISSLDVAVDLIGGAETGVVNNLLAGPVGVRLAFNPVLDPPTQHRILENRIEVLQNGVRLEDAAADNHVLNNRICLHTAPGPGIFLGPDTSDNQVRKNDVALLSGGDFTIVEDLGTDNKVGNTQRKRC